MQKMYLSLVENWDLKDHAKLTEVVTIRSGLFIILRTEASLGQGPLWVRTMGAIHQSRVLGSQTWKNGQTQHSSSEDKDTDKGYLNWFWHRIEVKWSGSNPNTIQLHVCWAGRRKQVQCTAFFNLSVQETVQISPVSILGSKRERGGVTELAKY